MTKLETKWFASWFNTDYYHILYKDRGYEEAQGFIKKLTDFLALKKEAKVLDLACGKGRHSVYLHELGFNVTGIDLSVNSISYAKQFEKAGLQFKVHDMCEPLSEKFDGVFNLFTSFGYFESSADNVKAIQAIKADLAPNGYGVIDFMNVHHVIKNLVAHETKVEQGIHFHLKRWVENGFIFKDIQFEDAGEKYHFVERVKALTLADFKHYFDQAGLQLTAYFGDYHLTPFHEETSDRLILIFQVQ